jgi:integrase
MPKAKKLPSGNWRAQVYAGTDSTGKRIMKSFTAPTKKQAEYEASLWQIERKEKMSGKLTVGQALEQYINSKDNILSPSTIAGYEKIRRNHLLEIQQIYISDLTHLQAQNAINTLSLNHSPKTVRNTTGLFYAATKNYTTAFANITVKQKEKREIQIPTDGEISLLLDNAQGELKIAIALAALAGLRRSEILALTWDKINFEKRRITINAASIRGKNNIPQIKAPKSVAGYRQIPISDPLYEILSSSPKETSKPVNLYESSINRQFNSILQKLNLPHYRFHDLRHYYASTLLAIGMPDKYAMKLMGHNSNNTLKQIYQHTMADKEKQFEHDLLAYQNSKLYLNSCDISCEQTF